MSGTVKFLWVLYGALTLVHLGTCVWDSSGKWRALTKILLMPMVLLCYLALAGEPRILVIGAILLGWGGDVLLLYSAQKGFFLAGISSFLAGHLCYAWALGLRGGFFKASLHAGACGSAAFSRSGGVSVPFKVSAGYEAAGGDLSGGDPSDGLDGDPFVEGKPRRSG